MVQHEQTWLQKVPREFFQHEIPNKDMDLIFETIRKYFYEMNIEFIFQSPDYREENLWIYFHIFESLKCEKALMDLNLYFLEHYFQNPV